MSTPVSAIQNFLKEFYGSQKLENELFKRHPLFKHISKEFNWGGKNMPFPVSYAPRGGFVGDFTIAQQQGIANQGNYAEFVVTKTAVFGNTFLAGNEIRESMQPNAAFSPLLKQQAEEMYAQIAQGFSNYLFRDGWGTVGQVAVTPTGATLQLTNPSDAFNLDVGQAVIFGSAINTAARALNSGVTLTGQVITKINRNTGVLTFGSNVTDGTNGTTGVVAGDFVFKFGDHPLNGAAATQLVPAGFEGWCPSVANQPGLAGGANATDLWFGQDRSFSEKLYGTSIDASNGQMPIREALVTALNKAAALGGNPELFVCNHNQYTQYANSLESKRYIEVGSRPEVGFEEGLAIDGAWNHAVLIADPQCPANRIFGLNLDSIKIYACGDFMNPWDDDGMEMLRHPTKDGIEVRYNCYSAIGVSRPIDLVNIQLPAVS